MMVVLVLIEKSLILFLLFVSIGYVEAFSGVTVTPSSAYERIRRIRTTAHRFSAAKAAVPGRHSLEQQVEEAIGVDWDKIEDEDDQHTPQEAEISASLYMNPATAKIASNVRVSWEPDVADTIRRLRQVSNPHRPFMVGIVGIPGSGKSTSATTLAALLADVAAVVMPMDGYHYSLAELSKFPNAADAIWRRGAPDTFNPIALARDLERIAYGNQAVVSIPGFDHAKGDPEENQHTFVRDDHTIVICEGLYLLHDNDGWENIQRYFDWAIYIDADIDSW